MDTKMNIQYIITSRYHKDEDSINRCANQILLFVENEAIPWFDLWRNEDALYTRQDSPLREELVHKYNKNAIRTF